MDPISTQKTLIYIYSKYNFNQKSKKHQNYASFQKIPPTYHNFIFRIQFLTSLIHFKLKRTLKSQRVPSLQYQTIYVIYCDVSQSRF